MLKFLKRRAFRSEAKDAMSYLLGFGTNDAVLADVYRRYPGIWKAIDDDFDWSTSAMASAVGVLTIAFTHEIEQRTHGKSNRRTTPSGYNLINLLCVHHFKSRQELRHTMHHSHDWNAPKALQY
jgi:hypothetical protein